MTGSNIRRVDSERASPIQIVSQEEIQRTGKRTVAEYLQTITADGQGAVIRSYDGATNVVGAYAKVLALIVKQVELPAAVRNDRYMGGDSATTSKFGVKYRRLEQLAIRATFARGFRAPNGAEAGDEWPSSVRQHGRPATLRGRPSRFPARRMPTAR